MNERSSHGAAGRVGDVSYPTSDAEGRSVLDGAFRLLRALPDVDRDHQLHDLARTTGIPRSSVYRLMSQLHAVGAVERVRGRYVVAQSLADITRRSEPIAGLRQASSEVMQALRARTGATISLVAPTEGGCSALEVLPGWESLPTPIHAGIVMPSTAAAALVLDPGPAPERADTVAGWANDDGRVYSGLTCFASAIRAGGQVEAVLQISTTDNRPARQFATLIRSGADRIASRLAPPSS
jgi:DNA-binding IclR family transcriptional regulator